MRQEPVSIKFLNLIYVLGLTKRWVAVELKAKEKTKILFAERMPPGLASHRLIMKLKKGTRVLWVRAR